MSFPDRSNPPFTALAVLASVTLLSACGRPAETPPGAWLEGSVTVRADVDSLRDDRDFEIMVLSNLGGTLDTLATAVTDSTGYFETAVRVPTRGIFPLIVSRAGTRLHLGEIVLAEGDSMRMSGAFPLEGRPLRIVSRENSAWTAYRNAKAQYNRTVLELLQSGSYSDAVMRRTATQFSTVMWSLRDLYPGTMGATVAEAESIALLESWDDSLAVARFDALGPHHPSILNLVRAVRRSLARLEGQEAAVSFVRAMADSQDTQAALPLRSELVVAYMDSLDRVRALAEARSLLADAGETQWKTWASRAIYELETLMPGMEAPDFEVVDVRGRPFSLSDLRGQTVLLEFFTPTNETFLREISERGAILGALRGRPFRAVSISLEPDSALNEALLDGRRLAGTFVFDPDGFEGGLARLYNVNLVPTRVLIGPDGRLLAKYAGPGLEAIRSDLAGIFGGIGVR